MITCSLNMRHTFACRILILHYLSPFQYQGDLGEEQEVFQWILTQKNDESIEDVDRETFLKYIETKDFLAVVFCEFINYLFLISASQKKTNQFSRR